MGRRGRNLSNTQIVVVIVVVILVVANFQAIMNFTMGLFGMVTGGTIITPPSGGVAPHKFTLYKRGTTTAITDASVYAWYDWDGDGSVDLGDYPSGEIEVLSSDSSTGLVTTGLDYPVGKAVLYQIHKTGYEVETFSRIRSSVPAAHDGSALSVANVFLTLTDTGVSRVSAAGELLVTATTDYNYTLSGSEPTIQFRHTATSTDAGINEQAFTHWGNGKVYGGTFIGVTYTNQDFIDLHPDGYSGVFVGASNTYVWYFVDGYFNDADLTTDNVFTYEFALDITAAGDIATIGMYNGVELDDLEIGVWGSALGTEETNLDFVA